MNIISVSSISKSFGEKPLFKNLTVGINKGDKIALVGINGCGKSTLLSIIARHITPDEGDVVIRKGIKISYLPQNPVLVTENSILEEFYKIENENIALILEYENLIKYEHEINPRKSLLDAYIHRLDAGDLWNYESRIRKILGKLGIYNLEQKIDTLSGGQQKRIAIAKVLLEEPDVLILDEPTNHLDLEIIEWLENYLTVQSLTLILVSHDRYFLENVTHRILELDQGMLYSYHGNYQHYLEKKSEREDIKKKDILKAKNLLRRELEWMRRMPKARGSKSRDRIERFKQLQKIATRESDSRKLNLAVKSTRTGKKVIEIRNVTLEYEGVKYINNFSYNFKRHDRIGVIGPNGIGKSSLLDLITGIIKPDRGNIYIGKTINIGYYTQTELVFNPEHRVIDLIQEKAQVFRMPDGSIISASQLLEHFQFTASRQYDFIRKLSGGEKRRLQLLMALIGNPNFLILDEPTNDLDLASLNVLEDFLAKFDGCILIVSHDRYFMDRLVDHLFVFSGNGMIEDFPGNYTDYRSPLDPVPKTISEVKQKAKKPEKPKEKVKKKLTYNEKGEFEQLSVELEELEEKKEKLLEKMNRGTGNHIQLHQWSKEFEDLTRLIDRKTDRWLILSEYAD